MSIILIVLFTMTMFMWLLNMLGAVGDVKYSPWLAWFSALFLGLAVFAGQAFN